jgi:hypothetical protein
LDGKDYRIFAEKCEKTGQDVEIILRCIFEKYVV